MLNDQDRLVALELKERLLQAGVPLLEMRVYGSRARGDFSPESDLDIFLLLRELRPDIERTINRLAWEVGFEAGVVVTTVEYTPEQVERSPLRASPFIRAIQRDGVAV